MTNTSKRKIIVKNIEYNWCIRGDRIDGKENHITIFKPLTNGQTLYLDPYPWALEVRPKIVHKAILFAIENHWFPDENRKPIYLGYSNDEFIVLPKGVKFTHEYKK